MPTFLISLVIAILALAVLVWGGEQSLALLPGNEKLKRFARIVAIVVAALWALSLVASFFGVGMPWSPTVRHR